MKIRIQSPALSRLYLQALFCVLAVVILSANAQAEVSKNSVKALRESVVRYQKAAMVDLDLEKKVVSELMGRERTQSAKASLAAKLFRLETAEPDRTLIVYDGSTLWNVQYPSEGSNAAIQAARTKLDKKSQNQVLLGSLLVDKTVMDKFELLDEKTTDRGLEISAKSKDKNIQVTALTFVVNTKDKLIRAIEYSDELGNKTTMTFLDTKFLTKKDSSKFKYTPEKGAKVTEL